MATKGDRFIVCTGCTGGADLAPVSLAVRAEGKAAYLFTGVDPDAPEDVAAFAKLYAESPDGQIMDARPAGALRFCLVGRIPA